jgi:hypothetical protein
MAHPVIAATAASSTPADSTSHVCARPSGATAAPVALLAARCPRRPVDAGGTLRAAAFGLA